VTFSVSNIFPEKGMHIFLLNARTGEINLAGTMDYEEIRLYEIQIEARDKGTPSLSGHCKLLLEVLDVND
ncbi:PCDAB protein, partial [Rhodinocichla rosea]|nr:PCDAB protein [Rhodinocichla rosea]